MGATGMTSRFFENTVAEIMTLAGESSPLALRRALARSRMLSSDVSAGFDPGYAGKFETKNAAFMGRGLCFNKYTGTAARAAPTMPTPSMWPSSATSWTRPAWTSRPASSAASTRAAAAPSPTSWPSMA